MQPQASSPQLRGTAAVKVRQLHRERARRRRRNLHLEAKYGQTAFALGRFPEVKEAQRNTHRFWAIDKEIAGLAGGRVEATLHREMVAGERALAGRVGRHAPMTVRRTAPRRRGAGRPRGAASRSSSRSGDSGDDSDGESEPAGPCATCARPADTVHFLPSVARLQTVELACPRHGPGGYWLRLAGWYEHSRDHLLSTKTGGRRAVLAAEALFVAAPPCNPRPGTRRRRAAGLGRDGGAS